MVDLVLFAFFLGAQLASIKVSTLMSWKMNNDPYLI